MQAEEFIHRVADRLGIDPDAAGRTARAALETLGQQLPADLAQRIAAQLPRGLSDAMEAAAAQDEQFTRAQFAERVITLEGGDADQAEDHVRVVMGVLAEAVDVGALTHLVGALPGDLADLVAERRS
jgi:uncharacterized protein (DUF2267 family)